MRIVLLTGLLKPANSVKVARMRTRPGVKSTSSVQKSALLYKYQLTSGGGEDEEKEAYGRRLGTNQRKQKARIVWGQLRKSERELANARSLGRV